MLEKFYKFFKKDYLKITSQGIEIYKQVINSKKHLPLIKVYKKIKRNL